MAEKVVRKKVTKKTVRKTATKKVAAKKVATKKTTRSTKRSGAGIRKAPTTISAQHTAQKSSNKILIAGFLFFIVVFAASAAIGMSEEGQIDINARLQEIRAKASDAQKAQIDSVGVQNQKESQNALVPSGVPVESPQSEEEQTASSTASSTADTATSTEKSASTTTDTVTETTSTTTAADATTTSDTVAKDTSEG